jgi:hypothetical protein
MHSNHFIRRARAGAFSVEDAVIGHVRQSGVATAGDLCQA